MDARHAAGLAAALAALASGCGESDPGEPPPVAGASGAPSMVVQDDAELLYGGPKRAERAMDLLQRSGVRAVRLTAGWSKIAPGTTSATKPRFDASDPGDYVPEGWARIDRAVKLARERGMAPMIDIAFWAPVWATAADHSERPRTGIDPREYGLFARAVARRYRGDVRTYTLWNEPNHAGFLAPQRIGRRAVSPHLYRRMVAAAYPAVKEEQPDSTVLVGGLAAHGRSDGVPPLEFLRDMACVDRRLRPVATGECARFAPVPGDGFAHHPYSTRTRPDAVERSASRDDVPLARIGRLTGMLDRLVAAGRIAPALRSVYITEYGYESHPPDPGARYTPERAARMMAFAEALASREPRVRSFAQFLVRDLPGGHGGQRVGALADWQSGLWFADGRPKPLLAVLPMPLHVERVDASFVRMWGRVRPGSGRRRVRIESSRPPGPWRIVLDGRTDPRGVVEQELESRGATAFRIGRRQSGRWVYGPGVDALR